MSTNKEVAIQKLGYEPSLDLTEPQKAWLAALWDGEGCIGISQRHRNGPRPNYFPYVSVANTSIDLILHVRKTLGDRAVTAIGGSRVKSGKTCFRISVRRHFLVPFLRAILPYLVAKTEQAKLAISFCERFDDCEKGKFPDEIFEQLYLEVGALNDRRGRFAK